MVAAYNKNGTAVLSLQEGVGLKQRTAFNISEYSSILRGAKKAILSLLYKEI